MLLPPRAEIHLRTRRNPGPNHKWGQLKSFLQRAMKYKINTLEVERNALLLSDDDNFAILRAMPLKTGIVISLSFTACVEFDTRDYRS